MLRILKQTLCKEMKKQTIHFKGVEKKSEIKRNSRMRERERERERDIFRATGSCLLLDCPYSEVI